jgi:flagellar hook protein FlgE
MLVTPDGKPVQGWTQIDPATGLVNTTVQPGRIVIPPGRLREPVATSLFSNLSNLDASAPVGASFTATIPILDALGVEHISTVTFTKTTAADWDYDITVPGAEVAGGIVGTPFSISTGNLSFDGLGALAQVNGAPPADVVIASPTWTSGAAATPLTWDLIDVNGDAQLSGFSATSATSSISQNGLAAGAVSAIASVNGRGEMIASFGAGRSIIVAQLALATFNNPQGLVKLGGNTFKETQTSGVPSVGTAGTGGRGSFIGSALEQSNVDIAQEFTQMILAQRGYQANSKSIIVADELLLETLNLKR